ncbi:MAG: helix-turn-helix transcriptional regulator, partial [Myxococcota bacterium]
FLECERALFAGTVNRMALGIVSLDQGGNLIESNQEARRILEERDGIWFGHKDLHLDNTGERKQFQQMVRSCLNDAGSGGGLAGGGLVEAMSVTRPSGRKRLSLLVRAIPVGPFSESRQRPAVAIFLRDPEAGAAPSAFELARNLFDFTHTEASLALLLTAGHSLDEGAAQLNIRRNTARTHLQAIFSKTGVSRQTMLVRLMHHSVIGLV